MKKIFILIIITFFLGGCYDNIELNNLAIISGIGIDYKDNEFVLTYEILNDIKTEENSVMLSYIAEGKGKSITNAFTNTNYKVGKKPYFAHLRIMLLSENVIQNHYEEICDFLIRDTDIRDEFISLVAVNASPKEILSHNSNHIPVVSDFIINLLNNEDYNNNLAIKDTFQNVLVKLISPNSDAVLSSVGLNNDELSLDNFYIFRGYNYQNVLSKENSTYYNLLTKDVLALKFEKEYPKGNVAINISHSKTDIDVTSSKIIVDMNLEGKIIDNNADFNLKDEKSYQKLNNDFAKVIQKKVKNFIQVLQKNKSDILGLQDLYYKKTRKNNYNLWQNANIEINVDLKINTKGFIFEVENEK